MTIYNVMGWGKGKTTSAIGITVRALGYIDKVLFCSFLKDDSDVGLKFLNKKFLNFTWVSQGTKNLQKEDCTEFWEKCMTLIERDQPDLVVFDELNVALDYNLFQWKTDEMLDKLKHIASDRDIYITGRINSHQLRHKMIEMAEIATNCYCEAHNYNRTCKKCGMDFNPHYEYCPICGAKLQKSAKARVGREC